MDHSTSRQPDADHRAVDAAWPRPCEPVSHDEPTRPVLAGLSVGRLLGRGGASVVWQVTGVDGRRFALKVSTTSPAGGNRSLPAGQAEPGGTAVQAAEASPRASSDRSSGAGSVAGPGASPDTLSGSSSGAPDPATPPVPTRRGRRAADASPTAAGTLPAAWPDRRGAGGERPGMSPGPATEEQPAGRAARRSTDPGALARELALLQRFAHEHLLRVHRILPTDQGPALLTDLAAGGSILALVTSRGPLPIPEVVTALVPMAQVLQHLHDAGAVHGDVTPGNILFTHEGKPLLADFGTGQVLGTDATGSHGTPGFIDPSRRGGFDPGADVFALAAVCWFAMTGRVPGPTEQRPPLSLVVPEVTAPLLHLIEDGLSIDRERRPSAGQFARTLLASSAARPVDLVPAVHPSVLPELVTRRSAAPTGGEPTGWRRLVRFRGGERHRSVQGAGPGRDSMPLGTSGRRGPRTGTDREPGGSVHSRSGQGTAATVRARRRAGGTTAAGVRGGTASGIRPGTRPVPSRPDDERDRRQRGRTAMIAGVLALGLLVAGLALTLGDPLRPGGPSAPPSSSGEEQGRGIGEAQEDDVGVEGDATGRVATGGIASGTDDVGRGPDGTVASTEGAHGDGEDRQQRATKSSAIAPGLPATPGLPAAEDPVIALGGLAERRAEAFATADPTLLRTVDVVGSPAMTADQEAVESLASSGTTLSDLTISIREPRALTADDRAALPALAGSPAVGGAPPGTAVSLVRATAALSSYTEERTDPPDGDVSSPLRAAGQQDIIFVLWDAGDGWRIHSTIEPPT